MSYRNSSDQTAHNRDNKGTWRRKREAEKAERQAKEDALSELVDRMARYLVFYDGRIVATFASADDALLFEAELADLDRDHGVHCVECKVFDRAGNLIGGYTITAGMMMNTVEDKDYERKYSGKRLR